MTQQPRSKIEFKDYRLNLKIEIKYFCPRGYSLKLLVYMISGISCVFLDDFYWFGKQMSKTFSGVSVILND